MLLFLSKQFYIKLLLIYKNCIILNLSKIVTLKFTIYVLKILTYSLKLTSEIDFVQVMLFFLISLSMNIIIATKNFSFSI